MISRHLCPLGAVYTVFNESGDAIRPRFSIYQVLYQLNNEDIVREGTRARE